jgi:hypothetical protein
MEQIKKYRELDIYFDNMDHVDIKAIDGGNTSLRQFISRMLSYHPWWITILYRLRKILVGLLGLVNHEKPNISPIVTPENVSFTPRELASIFIVHKAKEDNYWVVETPEDKHLKAYLGMVLQNLGNSRTRFHVFTSVKYLHWSGPVYFNIIRPFHHLVVWQMMKAGAER